MTLCVKENNALRTQKTVWLDSVEELAEERVVLET